MTHRHFLFLGLLLGSLTSWNEDSYAASYTFTVDTSGTGTGQAGVDPVFRGSYEAGSFLRVTGNISDNVPGHPTSLRTGNFSASSITTGSFPGGSPGSALDYLTGSLTVDLGNSPENPSMLAVTGGDLFGNLFNRAFPENPTSPVQDLAPQAGGGTPAEPGFGPANFGIKANTVNFGIFPENTAMLAMRDMSFHIAQTTPGSSNDLGTLGSPPFDRTFAANALSLGITTGTLDYNLAGTTDTLIFSDLFGSTSLVSSTPVSNIGGTAHLTSTPLGGNQFLMALIIPIQTSFTETIINTTPAGTETTVVNYTFTGSISAYATVPEPGSLVLAGLGLAGVIALGRRRRKR